ncbi:MAG: diaminopimelate epimerase [Candidatus Omnitrophica bacterium]|jgi:diaminopimelate epimerase|nr:diaminopimelate epimerase [Candidatus Omnitrophota bacterium]
MRKIKFTKMVASGNDFVVVDKLKAYSLKLKAFSKSICDRKYGAGADGLLILSQLVLSHGKRSASCGMRIFNADGSEAQMCGNGARCAALYFSCQLSAVSCQQKIKIETKAGDIHSLVNGNNVKIKLTDPKGLRLNIPIKLNGRTLKVNFINTGVPHAVIFVEGLDKIDVDNLGRAIRYHQVFKPQGANVNFVEVLNNTSIRIRTYERGVEGETLACGTGSVASGLLTAYNLPLTANIINVHTRGGQILKVDFQKSGDGFKDVWLEGKAKIVYQGEYYV